jgi:hypothetical protein
MALRCLRKQLFVGKCLGTVAGRKGSHLAGRRPNRGGEAKGPRSPLGGSGRVLVSNHGGANFLLGRPYDREEAGTVDGSQADGVLATGAAAIDLVGNPTRINKSARHPA